MALTVIDTLTDGSQASKISDGIDTVGITTVGGQKALNVAALLTLTPIGPANATISSIASSASSVILLASNPVRKGFIMFNDSTKVAAIAYAATASATTFTVRMPAGSLYEINNSSYTGSVSAIWNAANGFMRITELS